MKILLIEVCRSPEIDKSDTEAKLLSRQFDQCGLDYRIYSNDLMWMDPMAIDRSRIDDWLADWQPDIVHLATHGDSRGLVLQWSHEQLFRQRRPTNWLTGKDIRSMKGWVGRTVFSGACESGMLASDFLAAGATGVVAPTHMVPWAQLARFFGQVYAALLADPGSINAAVRDATNHYQGLSSYRVYSAPCD